MLWEREREKGKERERVEVGEREGERGLMFITFSIGLSPDFG